MFMAQADAYAERSFNSYLNFELFSNLKSIKEVFFIPFPIYSCAQCTLRIRGLHWLLHCFPSFFHFFLRAKTQRIVHIISPYFIIFSIPYFEIWVP